MRGLVDEQPTGNVHTVCTNMHRAVIGLAPGGEAWKQVTAQAHGVGCKAQIVLKLSSDLAYAVHLLCPQQKLFQGATPSA